MEYKLLIGYSIKEIEELVNSYLQEGWITAGGTEYIEEQNCVFIQAIIKQGKRLDNNPNIL